MTALSQYLALKAEWRERKAEEWPGDRRNLDCAQALRALAGVVERIDGRPYEFEQRAVDAIMLIDGEMHGVPVLGERGAREVARYGFDRPLSAEPAVQQIAHVEFLQGLANLVMIDTHEDVRVGVWSRVDDPEEIAAQTSLHPWEVAAALADVQLGVAYWDRRADLTRREQEEWIDASLGAARPTSG